MELEHLSLRARLRARPADKLRVWLGLAVGICVPYFTLQHVRLFPSHSVPELAIERGIPFQPELIWAYVSIAALVPLAPALASSRIALLRYAKGLALLCAACFLGFALFPVEGPRPETVPDHGLYAWIVSVDRPSNSMPSLHAGLVVYSILFALRAVRDDVPRRRHHALAIAACVWAALILYSTLATKQHWLLDLPAGAALAWLGHALAWRAAGRVGDPRGALTTG